MSGKLSSVAMRGRCDFRTASLCLFFVLCLALAGQVASAQEIKLLTKGDLMTPIYQMFYPEKNETVTIAPTGSAENMKMMGMVSEPEMWRLTHRELVLWDVSYTYQGRNPIRPQNVNFTFFVNQRKDRYRKNQSFSISVDGTVVHEGAFVLEQRAFEGNGKPVAREVLKVTVPTDVFLSVARAKKAQLELGSETFKLNGEQRKHLSVLATTIEPLRE